MTVASILRNGGNDMARYIDADELIKQMENSKYIDTETQFQLNVNAVINYWISEIKYFPSKNVVTNIDVAKEIFEEIDKHIVWHPRCYEYSINEFDYEEIKNKYTESENTNG